MIDFKMPDDRELERIQEEFSKNSWVDILTSSLEENRRSDTISLSTLYAYLTSYSGVDEALELKVRSSPHLRELYRKIVDQTAAYRLPEAMAASSGDYPVRHGSGCIIRMEASRAETDQIYVIIEITGGVDLAPTSMFVCEEDQTCMRFEVPEIKDGIIQLIFDRQSKLVELMMNPKTEVFLK